jgi:hypothetical protein
LGGASKGDWVGEGTVFVVGGNACMSEDRLEAAVFMVVPALDEVESMEGFCRILAGVMCLLHLNTRFLPSMICSDWL